MKRYDINITSDRVEFTENPNGQWVLYEDAIRLCRESQGEAYRDPNVEHPRPLGTDGAVLADERSEALSL